ncbi:MAG: hypothetical protein OSB38_16600 [Paraburkholderia fungorum]|nr:hypothetical protein [Paraburkholderia fungorum]
MATAMKVWGDGGGDVLIVNSTAPEQFEIERIVSVRQCGNFTPVKADDSRNVVQFTTTIAEGHRYIHLAHGKRIYRIRVELTAGSNRMPIAARWQSVR